MARQKTTPLRREPSSEYTAGTPKSSKFQEEMEINGSSNGFTNRKQDSSVLKALSVPKEAGALQFLIAVGGIYGSL